MVGRSLSAGEVEANRSHWWVEEVEGSQAEPLRNHHPVVVAVEEGGCPSEQVEVEGSCLAVDAWAWWVWGNSWQLREVEEEGGPGQEVVEEGSRPLVVVVVEVEVGYFHHP